MKISKGMRFLEIYYDGRCGMCGEFRQWLEQREGTVKLEFLDYHAARSKERFADLAQYQPEKAMVVRADTGEVYQGMAALLVCLWTRKRWRLLARFLAVPCMLWVFTKLYPLLANNRHVVSRLIIGFKQQ